MLVDKQINSKLDNIKIYKVSLQQVDELQKIGQQTFFETFAASNTSADMQKYLAESFAIGKLSTELSDPDTEFYFAAFNRKVIGYLKLNGGQSQTELQHDNALEIERIYVLQQFHGQQIGQRLFEKALQKAKQKNADYIWLGVWEENPRAINFYRKNGFVAFDKHIFRLGKEEQTDIMMKLNLNGN